MRPSALSFVSKSLIMLMLLLGGLPLAAQRKPKGPPGEKSFLDTQWWLGIRVGTVLTQPNLNASRSVFSPIDYDIETTEKTYDPIGHPGLMTGLDIIFYHKGFSIGIHPAYKKLIYQFDQNQTWNASGSPALTSLLEVSQEIHIIELPLLAKYDLIQSGKVRPFIQGGIQQSLIMDADMEATVSQRDFASDPPQNYQAGTFNLSNRSDFQPFAGWIAGLGVNLDYLNIRTILEANYQVGFQRINTADVAVTGNSLSGLGTVPDELTLNQLSFSVSFVFPLRYIDNTFSPY